MTFNISFYVPLDVLIVYKIYQIGISGKYVRIFVPIRQLSSIKNKMKLYLILKVVFSVLLHGLYYYMRY